MFLETCKVMIKKICSYMVFFGFIIASKLCNQYCQDATQKIIWVLKRRFGSPSDTFIVLIANKGNLMSAIEKNALILIRK